MPIRTSMFLRHRIAQCWCEKRVIEPLEAAGKTAVIPSKKNRKSPRTYDKALYVARHLIENFFCWVKQPSRHVTTKPPGTSWLRSTWSPRSFTQPGS
jgi:hypothetical protein